MFLNIRNLTIMTVATLSLTAAVSAAPLETMYDAQYCFNDYDFYTETSQGLDGIFITDVPSTMVASVTYGNRILRAGDVVPGDQLANLVLEPVSSFDRDAVLCFLPVSQGTVGAESHITVSILSGKNSAPVAKDSSMETYKNIANGGKFDVTDVDDTELTYQLVSQPKRGTVEVCENGEFTYTPNKNKVGEDAFVYTATDSAGNVSNQATVTIDIQKPTDTMTYADMDGDPDEFVAMWLRDQRLFGGETVSGNLCFSPDKLVTRGEFVVMLSELANLPPQTVQLTAGFADEESTPSWMQPYLVSALRAGVISGSASQDGLVFRPSANLTGAEAAVMLQNALQLPAGQVEVADFDLESTVPVWAEDAVSALSQADFPLEVSDCLSGLTRRDAANLLYAASAYVPDRPSIISALF